MKKLALTRVNYSQLYSVYDNGKTYSKRDILIPYHLITLASYIRKYKIDVRIFDGEVDLFTQEQLSNEILEWKADFVGLTSTTPDIDLNIEICNLIKQENSEIITIIGGPHASALPHDVSKNYNVDYVVVGDGEDALKSIICDGCDKKIIYGNRQNIRNKEIPAHDLLDYDKYQFSDPHRGRIKTASVMSSRGCPFNCNFCFHDKKIRYRTIDSFVEEIEYLYKYKDVRYFYVYDDTFLINKKRVSKIADGIKNLQISDAHFQCLTRGNLIDDGIVKKLRDVNFVRMSMGVESGCDDILIDAHKGVKKIDYIDSCNILKSNGVEARGSFIIGHPYETHKTVMDTINFSKQLDLFHANFNIMTPYPGTGIYEMTLKGNGLKFRKKEYSHKWSAYRRWGFSVIQTDDLSGGDLEYYQKHAQTEFYTQDKIFKYYLNLFKYGNKSKYFYRPLNFAWNNKFGCNISFWDELEDSNII